jgi:hypothetical protein
MRRLCCLLLSLLCSAEIALAAPAPLPRLVRKPKIDVVAQFKEQFAARGVTEWQIGRDPRYRNPILTFELTIDQLMLTFTIEVVNGDLAAALREALEHIDDYRGKKPR